MSYTPVTATITGSSIYANQQLLGLYELTGGDNIVFDSSGTIATTLDPSFTTLNVDGATSLIGDVSFGGDISANTATFVGDVTVNSKKVVSSLEGLVFGRSGGGIDIDGLYPTATAYYPNLFNIMDHIDSDYFEYTTPSATTNNATDGMKIKVAGIYEISYNYKIKNHNYTDRINTRIRVVVNGNDIDIGQTYAYLRHSDYIDLATNACTFTRPYSVDDYIKFEFTVAKGDDSFGDTLAGTRQLNHCSAQIKYLGTV